MTREGSVFAPAAEIADAVMREGQVLYPYRADAGKNAYRWPFGVVGPRAWVAHRHAEPWWVQAAALVHHADDGVVHLRVRWLQAVRRREADDPATDWDEAEVRHVDARFDLARLLEGAGEVALHAPAASAVDGATRREAQSVDGRVVAAATRHGDWCRLAVRVENLTSGLGPAPEDRPGHTARSLLATHVLLHAAGTRFGSLREPPADADEAAAGATGERLWTSLLDDHLAIAVPMVLPEPPLLAPASVGDSHDGTEIEEMMALRVRTLTPAERAAARATDPTAAAVIDRFERLEPRDLDRLHARMDPGGGKVVVGGVVIARGSAVRLAPSRRADAMDRLLAGRAATVTGVFSDLDGNTHVTVTVDDDPGADLYEQMGRGFHFDPTELVPLDGDRR